MNPTLKLLLSQLGTLIKNKQNGKEKPHKLILMQAILDLMNSGQLSENRIYFDDKLTSQFKLRFGKSANADDWEQPTLPFFHLRSSDFWNHKVIPGREIHYANLTTSGGGTKRIFENIEYAYLDSETFALLLDPKARKIVQDFVQNQIDASTVALLNTAVSKIGTAFHESFKLNRSGLAQVLVASEEANKQGEKTSTSTLKDNTSLGNNQVKSYRRYAKGAGLIDDKEIPTLFGALCLEFDHSLSQPETQWAVHYNMSAPHKAGPLYWNHLFCSFFTPDLTFSTEALSEQVENTLARAGLAPLAPNTYRTATTVLTGTYTDAEALGNLGLLQATSSNSYQVLDPVLPSPSTFACLLADYWEGNWPGRADVLLADLTAGPLAQLLLAEGRLGPLLREVEKLGLIRIQRRVPPYQVFRLWDASNTVWQQHLYPAHS